MGDDHEEWLSKFKKTKEGKIFDIKHEYDSLNSRMNPNGRHDIKSYCANVMWIMAKGTRFEEDIKYFIEELSPKFFKD